MLKNYAFGAYEADYGFKTFSKTLDVRSGFTSNIFVYYSKHDTNNTVVSINDFSTVYSVSSKPKITHDELRKVLHIIAHSVEYINRVKCTLPDCIFLRYGHKVPTYIPDTDCICRAIGGLDTYVFEYVERKTKKFGTYEVQATNENDALKQAKQHAKANNLMLFDGVEIIPSKDPKTFYRMTNKTFFTLAFRFGTIEEIPIDNE